MTFFFGDKFAFKVLTLTMGEEEGELRLSFER
jgi:hypothetical protein